jgi:kinesin family protein 3/17
MSKTADKNVECVRVVMRCRPLSSTEKQDGREMIVNINPSRGEVIIRNPKADVSEQAKTFAFDNVYDWTASQEQIYKESAFPIVDSVLEGYNGTIFAYGQTGTGKTHTMEGRPEPADLRGIIPRAFEQVFKQIDGTPGCQFLVRVSFLELYNEEIRDLLANNPKNKLDLREKPDVGVYVKDLISFPVQSVEEMHQKLETGRKNRAVGATSMNEGSSRSHSIFSITVEASEVGPDGQNHLRMGKLNLVDLAGSERQSKTQATGDRFKEAININQSLTTLGNVISALVDSKSQHIPYRDSKLTRLLQDSLGGNTKTVMVANIGPADWNFDETLSTLRYAHRAKNIKNKPKINEDPKDAMLREFQDEINNLKNQLAQFQGGPSGVSIGKGGERIVKVQDEAKIKEMEAKLVQEKEEIRLKAEEERKKIEAQKNLAEEEKNKLLENLRKQEEAQKDTKENQSKLLKKLKRMEEKVLIGTKAMEQALNQEKENQKIREELEKKRQAEAVLAEELAKKEEANMMIEKKYRSQQEEIEDKNKKLQKLYQKYTAQKSEIQDLQDEFSRERESYQEQIRELSRQLKLKNLVIDHFIPQDEANKIELRSVWSEEIDDWILPNLHLSGNSLRQSKPNSALGLTRPTTEYARMAKNFGDPNPRFRGDNVLDLPLDMPERTVEDFDGNVSEKVQNAINTALNDDDEDITLQNLENQPNVYYVYTEDGIEKEDGRVTKDKKKRLQSAVKKPVSAMKKKVENVSGPGSRDFSEDNYPKAKGLVSKKGFKVQP